MSSIPQPSTQLATLKRAYHAPVVQEFGNIREITQSLGTSGKSDGASPGQGGGTKNKTKA